MVVGTLVVFNLALAPLLLPVKSLTMLGMHQMIAPTEESVPRDATVPERTLVVVALPSDSGFALFGPVGSRPGRAGISCCVALAAPCRVQRCRRGAAPSETGSVADDWAPVEA